MSIFAIGDLHLSLGADKPMDVFLGWEGYVARLERNWRTMIGPQDTVILAGDTSWAMKLEETRTDFAFLQSLPGQKWLLKGNHDYWWTTARKMETFLAQQGFSSLHILHNNCCRVGDTALCGTRGWPFDDTQAQSAKIMAREAGRLRLSLEAGRGAAQILAFLHYPPVFGNTGARELTELLHAYGVQRCFYGHLHGKAIRYAVQGVRDGIAYKLISADGLDFCPYPVAP